MTSATRPLSQDHGAWAPPPLRPDLVVSHQRQGEHDLVMIKDPLARTYFKFAASDHALARRFDGRTPCAEVARQAAAQEKRQPEESDMHHVEVLAHELTQRGLLVTTVTAQRTRNHAGAGRRRPAGLVGWWARFASVLFMRIPVLDPDRLLTSLEKRLHWCWSARTARVAVGLVAAGLIVVLTHLEDLPTAAERSMNLPNLAAAWMLLVIVKIIHELGHGLTCKHYGGEVRELGVLVILFSPFFYVNVTDSYLFPRRYQRIAVAAAGIVVELVISAVAAVAWAAARPGPTREVLFSLMMITSIWTILFNANPLMKFDGYYILSDLVGMPNLRTRAMNAASSLLDRLLLGIKPAADTAPGAARRSRWLAAFGLASQLYTLLVLAGFVALLRWFGQEVGLNWAGDLAAMLLAVGMVGMPVIFYLSSRLHWLKSQVRGPAGRRPLVRLGATLGAGCAVLLVPVSSRPVRQAVVLPVQTAVLRAEIPGRLEAAKVATGQHVRAGDLLLTLSSPMLQRAVEQAEHRVAAAALAAERLLGADMPALLAEARTELTAAEAALEAARKQRNKTQVRSPIAGVVVTEALARQTGRGFRPGEVLCEIVAEEAMEAHVPVAENSLEQMPPTVAATTRVRASASRKFHSTLPTTDHTQPFRELPAALAPALEKELAVVTGAEGRMVPVETYFGLRVPLPKAADAGLKAGMTATVRFECGTQPLGRWLWHRWLEFMDPSYRL